MVVPHESPSRVVILPGDVSQRSGKPGRPWTTWDASTYGDQSRLSVLLCGPSGARHPVDELEPHHNTHVTYAPRKPANG